MHSIMARIRFQGKAEELSERLDAVATGKSFVRFDESKKVTEAKLDTTKVTASHPVLEVLHDLQDKLSFPRSTTKEAVGLYSTITTRAGT